MDLHTWMLNDLDSQRSKLFGSVIGVVPDGRWAERVDGGGASLTHLLVHLARHHDLAVNTAVRDQAPLFEQHRTALGLDARPTGAAIAEHEDAAVAAAPPAAVIDYVSDVFDSTERWLTGLGSMVLDTVPDVSRRLRDIAALDLDEFDWLDRQWSGKAVWWFLQWPVLGHGWAHFGEALGIRTRVGLSPF